MFENSEFISLISLVPVFKTTPVSSVSDRYQKDKNNYNILLFVRIKYIHLKWAVWSPCMHQ